MILLFVHGWGFDQTVWQGVTALLPELDCRVADRGYFGEPCAPACDGDTLVIAHSLGAMRMLAAPPAHCRGIVAINGFERFSADGDWPGIAPRVLDRMQVRLEPAPAAVVSEFRARCGAAAADGPMRTDTLRNDLALLRDGDARDAAARWTLPLVTLEAEDDPILPPALRDAAFASVPGRVRLRQPTGGHLLPVTDPAACAAAIKDLMEAVR